MHLTFTSSVSTSMRNKTVTVFSVNLVINNLLETPLRKLNRGNCLNIPSNLF